MQTILMVGCGDVARRILPRLTSRFRVFALLRKAGKAEDWRQAGAIPMIGDLDQPASLQRLAGLAQAVLHLAPPPNAGVRDTRTRHLLAALGRGESLPRRLVYVSTTGVYGDCGGERIDETRRLQPESDRAIRRVDAESCLRDWGRRRGVAVSILRAPGIYAADRLPLERLEKGLPALVDRDDVFTNHIHAEDLAAACVAALHRGGRGRAVNVVDDSDLRMADYFDRVAEVFELAKPPRLTRNELATVVSPVQLSFMRESRRIGNRRLKSELGVRLAYPHIEDGLAAAKMERMASCS